MIVFEPLSPPAPAQVLGLSLHKTSTDKLNGQSMLDCFPSLFYSLHFVCFSFDRFVFNIINQEDIQILIHSLISTS